MVVFAGQVYNYVEIYSHMCVGCYTNIFPVVCRMLYIVITEVYILQELAYSGGHGKISFKS
jgi:hypothetical protein